MTDVSIIIPVYNVAPYIKGCIDSVMTQKDSDAINIECLIVDDCGTDDSIRIAEDSIGKYSGPIRFRIIKRDRNGGLSAARNSGIKEASGKYLYFLDSDDSIAPHCISCLWEYVKEYPDVNIVYGPTVCTPDASHMKGYFDFMLKGAVDYCTDISRIRATHFSFPATAWNKLINLSWLKNNGLYFLEGVLHEDEHWHLHAYGVLQSYACAIGADPTYYYLQRGGSIISELTKQKHDEAFYSIYSDLAPELNVWDHRICRKYCDILLELKGKSSETYHQRYRTILKRILKNAGLGAWQRLLFGYLGLPSKFVKGRIAYSYIKIFI